MDSVNAFRDTVLSAQVYRSDIISIRGHKLYLHVMDIDIQNFDAIIGIHWFLAYDPKFSCFHKIVTFYFS